jgi:RNA polymerase sigma-70 factor (ECF subfamily)
MLVKHGSINRAPRSETNETKRGPSTKLFCSTCAIHSISVHSFARLGFIDKRDHVEYESSKEAPDVPANGLAVRVVTKSSPGATDLPQPELVAAIPRLRRYARVLTRSPARADDLVQETLVRAWDKRRLWQAGSDLRAWLFTIMHNVYVNQCARARRETGTISLDAENEHGAVWQVAQHGNQLERIELRQVVEQMDRLPAEQREVLLLAAVEELRYEEIAAALAIPLGTVMSRLSRARDKLRRMAAEPPMAFKAKIARKDPESQRARPRLVHSTTSTI